METGALPTHMAISPPPPPPPPFWGLCGGGGGGIRLRQCASVRAWGSKMLHGADHLGLEVMGLQTGLILATKDIYAVWGLRGRCCRLLDCSVESRWCRGRREQGMLGSYSATCIRMGRDWVLAAWPSATRDG